MLGRIFGHKCVMVNVFITYPADEVRHMVSQIDGGGVKTEDIGFEDDSYKQ